MGPLKESCKKDHKMQDKEFCRSRIPRLVLRPHLPQQHFQYQKVSPASESPFSEEESKEFNPLSSSGGSARTISSNSFCSDDTGCPSSQSVSPVKTPPDTGNSPIAFCTGSDGGDYARKKFNSGTVADGTHQPARYKKEAKTNLIKPGSEADFSSSSSTGSISAPEVHMSGGSGNKRSSFSRKYVTTFYPASSRLFISGSSPPTTAREKDFLSMLCKNQLSPVSPHQNYGASSASSSNSGSYKGNDNSPTFRQVNSSIIFISSLLSYHFPNLYVSRPENISDLLVDLTPTDPNSAILLSPLKPMPRAMDSRYYENRVMKELDFIDYHTTTLGNVTKMSEGNIVKSVSRPENISDLLVDLTPTDPNSAILLSPLKPMPRAMDSRYYENRVMKELDFIDYHTTTLGNVTKMSEGNIVKSVSRPENISDLLVDLTPTDPNSAILLSPLKPMPRAMDSRYYENRVMKELDFIDYHTTTLGNVTKMSEGNIVKRYWSSNFLIDLLAIGAPINIFKAQDVCPINPSPVLVESSVSRPENISDLLVDLTPTDPNSAILLSPLKPMPRAMDSRYYENRVMKELDFIDYHTTTLGNVTKMSEGNIVKRYWSSNFLIDLLAIGAPIVPTIMWMFSTRRGGTIPIFTFGALFRGCCLLALNSLRQEPVILQR
ncbi:syntabulin [Ahaetulla prasina]|uniref:syntabulin n=1 Tax=Ahaetulla prasina TaxID=499056 RepID=UPI002647C5AA|nr:syntabulin [Ahaetulla prasina]